MGGTGATTVGGGIGWRRVSSIQHQCEAKGAKGPIVGGGIGWRRVSSTQHQCEAKGAKGPTVGGGGNHASWIVFFTRSKVTMVNANASEFSSSLKSRHQGAYRL